MFDCIFEMADIIHQVMLVQKQALGSQSQGRVKLF